MNQKTAEELLDECNQKYEDGDYVAGQELYGEYVRVMIETGRGPEIEIPEIHKGVGDD